MSWFSSRPAGWRNIKLGKFSPILVSAFAAGTLYSGYVFFNLPSKTEATQKTLTDEDVFCTTLMTHLFGRHQDSPLTYGEFIRFMQNVQTEALDVEFRTYSMGLPSINPEDFAKIILRHTKLSHTDRENRINHLRAKLSDPVPITFEDFQKFFTFLNCLDDFSMAMKLYTIAERPISLRKFHLWT
ncbi:EF-hand domain-containing family member A2 [Fasciolopsis buskii]|uniref:EF-hand domain-containing family member A2 n=1 Tax=Fasciolopsis buskii TaxID=27845 RepID=A0A8E0RMS6_9TREM|nr:EF-hand domain-containing family member A2 [Fasciolopsis buski]